MNLDASLSTAEAEATGMVAPGQQGLLDEFVAEQEAAQQGEEEQRILGKFKSPEDLAKAYQELEKKLGQPRQTDPEDSPMSEPSQDDAAEADGEEADYYELTADEVAEIKALAGGDEQYKQLGQWARDNLPKDVVDEFNAAVAKGNVQAIRWAVRALAAQATGASQPDLVEPELVSGKAAGRGLAFESQAQVLDAMNKKNERGQRLYDVDEAYRNKVQDAIARSDVF